MRAWILGAAFVAAASGVVKADPVADFYKGKTVSIFVGIAPGGIYSNMAQTLSRHMGRHIPGTPNMIVQHQVGAGGTIAINHVYNIAPKDGTVLLTPNAALTKRVVLGEPNTEYDPLKFNWLGGWGEPVNDCTVLKTSPALTIKDAQQKEVVIGAIDTATTNYTNPLALNNIIQTRFKLVPGYRGGSEIRLAMERGEVHGFCGQYESWTMGAPEWLKEGRLVTLVQFTSRRAKELPDVPTASELGRTDEERELLSFIQSGPEDRAMAAPPGVPPERLAALEKAYMATLGDPKFLEDAAKQNFPIVPTPASEIRAYAARLMQITPETVGKLKKATGRS